MTCAEFDARLCDYIDETLSPEERAVVENHLATCAPCAELARDASGVLAFLERVPEPELPPALVTRILQQTPAKRPAAVKARSGLGRLFGRWLDPILQPRLVMGMAMTILSFAMLGRFAGIEARQLRPADLHPVKVWEATEDRLHRTWTQAVKYYESLRIVYVVQSRLRDLTATEDDSTTPEGQEKQEQKQEQKTNPNASGGSATAPKQ